MNYIKTHEVCSQWGTHPHERVENHYAEGTGQIMLTQYDPPKFEEFPMCYRCADENFGPSSRMNFRDAWNNRVEWDTRFRWVVKPVAE